VSGNCLSGPPGRRALGELLCLPPGALRLLLAFAVVLHHASRFAVGTWAVDVFFLMSGYWVTVMYRQKYSQYNNPVVAFYVSRYLRLLPVYIICQLGMLGMLYGLHSPTLTNGMLSPLWVFRCLAIIGSDRQLVVLGPAWSLDIEVQFYLILPLIILLADRYPESLRKVILLAFAICMFPLVCHSQTNPPDLLFHATFFLFGVTNAYFRWRPSVATARASLVAFVVVVCLLLAVPFWRGLLLGGQHPINRNLFQHNGEICALLTLIFAPFVAHSVTVKSSLFDRHMGGLAYPVYLFHWIPHYFTPMLLPGLSPVRVRLVDFSIVLFGSLAIYVAVDSPAEKCRARWMKRNPGLSLREKEAIHPITY
jgi:peptidoglycan/LPS O-acetylase OafA/YrhL